MTVQRNFSTTSDPIELVVERLLLNVDQVVFLLTEACRGPQRYPVLGQSKTCQLPLQVLVWKQLDFPTSQQIQQSDRPTAPSPDIP